MGERAYRGPWYAAITLKIYSHMFDKQRSDAAAVDAIAAAMRGGTE